MKEISGDDCFKVLDNNKYILLYFGASWCSPCQKVLPLMDNLINEYDSNLIDFYKIDIDRSENKTICDKCKIKSVPAFLLFNGRIFINRTKGNNIPAIKNMINEVFPIQEEKKSPLKEEPLVKKDPFAANKEIFNKERIFK